MYIMYYKKMYFILCKAGNKNYNNLLYFWKSYNALTFFSSLLSVTSYCHFFSKRQYNSVPLLYHTKHKKAHPYISISLRLISRYILAFYKLRFLVYTFLNQHSFVRLAYYNSLYFSTQQKTHSAGLSPTCESFCRCTILVHLWEPSWEPFYFYQTKNTIRELLLSFKIKALRTFR